MRALRGEILRYLSVGVLNTLVGLTTIWGLMLLGTPPIPANVCGYTIGLVVSFYLNRKWTFRVSSNWGMVVRYILVFAVAYALNLLVLYAGIALFDSQGYFAQLPAMVAYSVSFYLLSKFFVFVSQSNDSCQKQ